MQKKAVFFLLTTLLFLSFGAHLSLAKAQNRVGVSNQPKSIVSIGTIGNIPTACLDLAFECPDGSWITSYCPDPDNPINSIEDLCVVGDPPQDVCQKPFDFNNDDRVDLTDYAFMLNSFFNIGIDQATDLNCDEIVDLFDYSLLISNFSLL